MAIPSGGTRRHGGKTLVSNEALSREISCPYAAAAMVISSGAACRYGGKVSRLYEDSESRDLLPR